MKRALLYTLAGSFLLFAIPIRADLPTKKVLTLDVAKKIAAASEAEAKRRGSTVVIVVVDDGGHLLLLERLDDTQVASVKSASEKRGPRLFSGGQAKSLRIRCVTGGSRRWRCPVPLRCKAVFQSSLKAK